MLGIIGWPGRRTMETNGGSRAWYLPCTPTLFNRSGSRRAFRLPVEGRRSLLLYDGTFDRSCSGSIQAASGTESGLKRNVTCDNEEGTAESSVNSPALILSNSSGVSLAKISNKSAKNRLNWVKLDKKEIFV